MVKQRFAGLRKRIIWTRLLNRAIAEWIKVHTQSNRRTVFSHEVRTRSILSILHARVVPLGAKIQSFLAFACDDRTSFAGQFSLFFWLLSQYSARISTWAVDWIAFPVQGKSRKLKLCCNFCLLISWALIICWHFWFLHIFDFLHTSGIQSSVSSMFTQVCQIFTPIIYSLYLQVMHDKFPPYSCLPFIEPYIMSYIGINVHLSLLRFPSSHSPCQHNTQHGPAWSGYLPIRMQYYHHVTFQSTKQNKRPSPRDTN